MAAEVRPISLLAQDIAGGECIESKKKKTYLFLCKLILRITSVLSKTKIIVTSRQLLFFCDHSNFVGIQ